MMKNLTFEVNPNHEIITKLNSLRKKDSKLASLMAKQILDNTMIGAGMLSDPKPLVDRIYKIMAHAMDSAEAVAGEQRSQPHREIEDKNTNTESVLKQKP